ncbi:MAG: D-alanyl-D-alanine carboxypeptidase [Lachnospiraceae bacterium]|nr:D-alanyl-D-alanine carboxypeptidase [Lachnospiraceae bacterium]
MSNRAWMRKLGLLFLLCGCTYFLLGRMENRVLQYEKHFQKGMGKGKSITTILYEKKGASVEKKEPDALYARSAALYDAHGGRVLFGKKHDTKMAMASTTKIMTCIVILEYGGMDDIVTVSKNAARQPDVQLNINTGEQYYLKDLLYSLMLESHNDTAVALAEHVGGSVEGFASLMNKKANEIGCKQTNFVTPNGLDATEHYTTAEELCKIAAYAIKNEKFLEIIRTSSHSFREITKGRSFVVSNKNRFLQMYNGAIGVKTGFTGNAGYCFVGAVRRGDNVLVSAVLGSGWPPNKNYKWSDTKALMDYGFTYYTKQDFFQEEINLPTLQVLTGKETEVSLKTKEITVSMLSDGQETEKVVMELQENLVAPIQADEKVGSMYYYLNDKIWKEEPIYTAKPVDEVDFFFALEKIWRCWTANAVGD